MRVYEPTGLAADLLDLLPPEVRDAYDLDELVLADWSGQVRWAIKTATGYLLGENVSAVLLLAIAPLLDSWEARWAPPAQWA